MEPSPAASASDPPGGRVSVWGLACFSDTPFEEGSVHFARPSVTVGLLASTTPIETLPEGGCLFGA